MKPQSTVKHIFASIAAALTIATSPAVLADTSAPPDAIALSIAIKEGRVGLARQVFERGVLDVSTKVPYRDAIMENDGIPLLSLAIYNSQPEMIKMLIKQGADVNATENRPGGWTPLMYATNYHQMDTVRLLLDNGADVDKYSGSGVTPLMFIVATGDRESKRDETLIAEFIRRGADLQKRDYEHGRTVLEWAKYADQMNLQYGRPGQPHYSYVKMIEKALAQKNGLKPAAKTPKV